MDRLDVTLPGVAASVPPARRFVERTLAEWGLDGMSWSAALVVTELASNAALHAGTDFTVALSLRGERLRLEVHDGSGHVPRQRQHSVESTTGRGLRLVAHLAAEWGVQPRPDGKTVWAELVVVAAELDDSDDDVDQLLSAFTDDSDEPDVAGHGRAPVGRVA